VITYLSQFTAVSGVKEGGSDLLKCLIQGLWEVALFQMIEAIFHNRILLASSGSSNGRVMAFCLQKFSNFAPGYQRLTTVFPIQL